MAVRTTRITVETETCMVLRRAKTSRAWCRECAAEVDAIVLSTTSLREPEAARQIQQWIDTGNLHFWPTPEGLVGICLVSLLQQGPA